MASFYYKTYVHILFSQENSIICPNLEEVYFSFIACFQQTIRRHFFRMYSDTLLAKFWWSQYESAIENQTSTSLRHHDRLYSIVPVILVLT